jgi:MoxR-like ATPase
MHTLVSMLPKSPEWQTLPTDLTTMSETSAPPQPRAIEPKDVEACQGACGALQKELGKVIVGQRKVIEEILIAIFTRSHALLVGVPGLAKTLLISSLADSLNMSFRRIQFTPDLMPSDITGTEIIVQDPATGEKEFRFLPGPLFANVVLADEINRTPPKTQAAMLEAMQERKVTVGGVTRPLPEPFFVLATQNPLEQEGTYPLPEAQLDRFMFLIRVGYPTGDEELEVMMRASNPSGEKPKPIIDAAGISHIQKVVAAMPVGEHVFRYARDLVRCTRPQEEEANEYCKQYLTFGAGPRASLCLIQAAKAHAMIRGQMYVSCANIAAVAPSVLRHRIAPNFTAQSEGISADDIVKKVIAAIPKHDG